MVSDLGGIILVARSWLVSFLVCDLGGVILAGQFVGFGVG